MGPVVVTRDPCPMTLLSDGKSIDNRPPDAQNVVKPTTVSLEVNLIKLEIN
jgi:hypothetical protein